MPTPINSNFLSPQNFKLSLHRLPDVVFNATSVNIPSLTMGYCEQSTPMIQLPVLGDKIEFSPLVIEFLIDEDMRNFKAAFEWLVSIGHPESLDQYATYHEAQSKLLLGRYSPQNHSTMYSDGILEILTNNSTPNNNVHFTDLFPIGLSPLQFVTTTTNPQYLTARLTFKFSGFEFI